MPGQGESATVKISKLRLCALGALVGLAVAQALLTPESYAGDTRAVTDLGSLGAIDLLIGPDGNLAPPAGITYGTDGSGNPKTDDCTVTVDPGGSINSAISAAGSGAVICVRAGDYSGELVSLAKGGVTVRSNGVGKIKGAEVSGDGSTLDGFTVVGAGGSSPESGILVSGSNVKVLDNLINGTDLIFGVRCAKDSCNDDLIAGNTVTGIESIGMKIENGSGTVVERNNIYDLHNDTGGSYDTDGMRFWGKQTIRYNYIHDINEFSSGNRHPHTDCFQTYNNGSISAGTLIENNYCLRVSRQCLIAQNNSSSNYEIRDITFRDNVCETYDSQGINLGSMSGVVLDNNLIISGFKYQIVNLEAMTSPNTNTTIRNNVLVRVESGATTYRRSGASTDEHFSDNLELLDTSLNQRDDTFNSSSGPYPASTPSDFTDYRAYEAKQDVGDKGGAIDHADTDIDGQPRIAGAAIDLGAFEIR